MSTQILPTNQPIYYCVSNPSVLLTGMTHVGELTGVAPNFDVIADADPLAFVAALPGERFEPLPESGWLEQGALYRCGDEVVLVRQSHFRTAHHPADVPALFIVWREDAPGLDWVAGEQVYVGTRRLCAGIEYECLQAHVTQSDWTPPSVPALWRAVVEPSAEWQAGTAYKVGDRVLYAGLLYECRQAHMAQVGWEPPNVLALWLPV